MCARHKSIQSGSSPVSRSAVRSWSCPRCSYSLGLRVDRCPECGTRLSLQADPRDSFTLKPAEFAACLGFMLLICAMFVVTIVVVSAERLRDLWQINAREGALESATLRAFEWCKSGADPNTWPSVLFDPQYPPKESLSKAISRTLLDNTSLAIVAVFALIVSLYVVIRVVSLRESAVSLRDQVRMKFIMLGAMLVLLVVQLVWIAAMMQQYF